MALLWIDSFDDRTSNYGGKYDASFGSAGMVGSAARTGNGLNLVAAANNSLTKTFSARSTYLIGMALTLTNGGVTIPFLEIRDGATVQAYLQVNAANQIQVVRGDGTVLGTGVNQLSSSTFAYLEWKATIHNTTGIAQVKINDLIELNLSGLNLRQSGANQGTGVRVFCETGVSNSLLIDDYYLADDQGARNNDFLGAVKIYCLRPTGAGSHTDLLANSGLNWDAVNDTDRDDDTTFVAAQTAGQIDTYQTANLALAPSGIPGAQLTLWARRDDLLIRKVAPVIRHGSTDYVGADLTLTPSYAPQTTLYETNPGTAAPWTSGDVNAVEIGVKCTA